MQELNKIIEDEVRDGTLLATDGYFPPTYPFIGAGTGVAFKKWKEQKPRITWAADPLTIPEKDAQGKPWAVNAGEPEDQPMMTWHRTKDYANAGAVIYAVYRSVVARRPDLKNVLIPESCSFDYKGFYRQLFMKLPSLCQQGFFFSKPDGSPRWLCSPSMLFGGDEYPNFSMRAAAALVAAITRRLQEFEERLQRAATSGDKIAILHCPAELQIIKSIREQKFRKEGVFQQHQMIAFLAQFIDDFLAVQLGVIRLMACMCIVWWVTDDGNFKLSLPKSKCGQISTELGLQFVWAQARAQQMEDKRMIAMAWCQRIISLRRITRKEFESAIGTLQFGTAGLQQGNIHLARSFRALHVAALWKGKKRQMTIPDWLKTDLSSHYRLMQAAVEVDSAKSFFNVAQIPRSIVGLTLSLTDACRTPRGFSGGGGIIAFPSRKALAFHFEFTPVEAAKLPIHILEFFCMLVAVLIISVMTPGAVVAEYQDNQAVVFAVQLLRSSDPRFQEGILLREAILERGNLDSRQEYIKSELNDVADPASRNQLQTMRKNAKSHGWKIEAELNRIALVQLIPDFEILLARLIALTDAMHDPARSQDKFN